ncbi:Peptidyl-prolyl cis-trans isomerase FKBP62 [Porphyridium purpureum]|uniref:peptidylprolyl isomerase n=1 Tax=Porphyridium purpureum TaxID=35688 RepID=A0A5J4YYV7_PORPP|nr:Peptidyl-prolyl cis-trans isomerase FKBP62 [Porphyridium purpureum]|eukprot:POR6534..scf209_3
MTTEEKLTPDGGVVKKILQEGAPLVAGNETLVSPQDGDECFIHYAGRLEDGTEFDSSRGGEPFRFVLGKQTVISGWEVMAKAMKKGEKALVTLQPSYAYGAKGSPPKIPPDATLIFECELVNWVSHSDIFGDGKAIKTILNEGEGWERPGRGSIPTVSVRVRDASGEKTLLAEQQITFTLGAQDAAVNALIDTVTKDMKAGAVWQVKASTPHSNWQGKLDSNVEACIYEIKLEKWMKVESVSKDGGVMKKVLSDGEGWERPNEWSVVVISARGWVSGHTDRVFMELKERNSVVSNGELPDALESTILTMKKGERALVSIAPEHGYKVCAALKPENVSLDDALEIEVTLHSFEPAKQTWSMTFEEKLSEMKVKKQRGNELFAEGRYGLAIKLYERTASYLAYSTSELQPNMQVEVNLLLVQTNVNLAICHEKQNDFESALKFCRKALAIDPSNIKALFREATALIELEDYFAAENVLNHGLAIEPENAALLLKKKQLHQRQKQHDARDKKVFKNMLRGAIGTNTGGEDVSSSNRMQIS